MRTFKVFVAALFVAASLGFAQSPVHSPYQQVSNMRLAGAEDPSTLGSEQPAENGNPILSLDDPLGEIFAAGTTWYDLQHNGSAGKMIAVDDYGYVHLVWMNGLNSANNPRQVYYQVWDPTTHQMSFLPTGYQINSSVRAGYACLAVKSTAGPFPGGWAFPAFHETNSGGSAHSAAAIDFLPGTGAFTTTQPTHLYENGNALELIWPKIAIGPSGVLHMVSMHNTLSSERIYYSRGLPQWDQDGFGMWIVWQTVGPDNAQFVLMDSSGSVSADVAASKISNRVAMAWTQLRPAGGAFANNSDVFYKLSEDGGLTWGPSINLTNFAAPDTFRAFTDVSVLFDDQDYLHIAFTTGQYSEELEQGLTQKGLIWHWSEQTDQFSALAEAWYMNLNGSPGGWMLNVSRPSLSVDPVTGFVYCSYQKFDTSQVSDANFFNADAWVTVSTDAGVHWSVGRNVTQTPPLSNPAPAGASRSERDITLADRVTYPEGTGLLHLEWELDRDAGTHVTGEGVPSYNTIYYQRLAVDEIPLTPLMPTYPLHVGPQLPTGRCCYGDPHQPLCDDLEEAQCAALGGSWDGTLTCATPCPVEIQCTCQEQPNTHCNLVGGPIPDADLNGTDFLISVPIQYHITDLNVCLDVTHEAVSDLIMTLTSPQGTTVALIANNVYGANLSCTSFDDEALFDIWEGTAPYYGNFRPLTPLNTVDGENALGDWVLHVVDTSYWYAGTLNWVCLSFNYDEILPVELSAFSATAQSNGIEIAFSTASETNTDHFEIFRGLSELGSFEKIANLASEGSSSSGHAYRYLDEHVTAGHTFWYYLVDVDVSGSRTEHRDFMSSADMQSAPVPLEYSLSAYPNPFNANTTLNFGLKEEGLVTLTVFNVAGQKVAELVNRSYQAGTHTVRFDAKELPSGIYFAKLHAGTYMSTEKLVLMK